MKQVRSLGACSHANQHDLHDLQRHSAEFPQLQKVTNTNLPIRHSVSLAAPPSATVQSRGQFIIINSSSSPTDKDIAGVTSHHQSWAGLKGNGHENPGISSDIRRCCFNQFEESGSENILKGKQVFIYIYMCIDIHKYIYIHSVYVYMYICVCIEM